MYFPGTNIVLFSLFPAGRQHSFGPNLLTNTIILCKCDILPSPHFVLWQPEVNLHRRMLSTLFLLIALNANSQLGAETAIQRTYLPPAPQL